MPVPGIIKRFQRARSGAGRAVRVLFVEDSPDHQEMYAGLFIGDTDLEYIGCVDNSDNVLAAVAGEQPIDVIVLDYHLPGSMTGIDLARELRRLYPRMGILLFTNDPILRRLDEFLKTTEGAGRGFLVKGVDDGANLTATIKMIANGTEIVSPGLRDRYKRIKLFHSDKFDAMDLGILEMLKRGLSYKAIARSLVDREIVDYEPAERTIQDRVEKMAKRLGIENRDSGGEKLDQRVLLVAAYCEVEHALQSVQ